MRLISFIGLAVMLGAAWGMSENRSRINWRLVAIGLGLQAGAGVLLLMVPGLREAIFAGMRWLVDLVNECTREGTSIVFGALASDIQINEDTLIDAAFAFSGLPVIIFVSALSAILHYLGIIQLIVRGVAWLMRRTMKTSGAETLGAALLIFLGIESMAAIQAYLNRMTRSELCAVMSTFMATIAGSVLVIYANLGVEPGHLLTASLMSAPAALVVSKMLVPETDEPATAETGQLEIAIESHNVVDAAAQGTNAGLRIALSVGAMLIAFVAIIHLLNVTCLGITGGLAGIAGYEASVSFTDLAGYVFWPVAFLMGVAWEDVPQVAELLGTKTVINEFVAYMSLSETIQTGDLSPRSITLATYALCGFANPGSIGIAIAALDALAPDRRKDVTSLAWKSFVGGTLACFMTACIAGVLLYE